MIQEEKDKFQVGKWYKDNTDDFIKFKEFERDGDISFTANVRKGVFNDYIDSWMIKYFSECVPMTIEEMKEHLPESEWWEETTSDLFPIY